MLRLVCLVLLFSGLSACKQTTIIDPPVPIDPGLTWQANLDFIYRDKVQLNSYADSTIAILAGSESTAIASKYEQAKTDTTFVHYGGIAQPDGQIRQRPTLSAKLLAFAHPGRIDIIPASGPVNNYSNASVRMAQVDSDFAELSLIRTTEGDCMAFNKRRQLLVPYSKYDRSYNTPVISGNGLNAALISTSLTVNSSYEVLDISSIRTLTIPQTSYVANSLLGFGDYILIGTSSGIYQVASDATYQKVYTYVGYRLFVLKNTLYCIAGTSTNTLALITSSDKGATWQVLTNNLPSDFQRLQFRQINNELIATYNSQLFQLITTPTTLTTVELDNTGLVGNQITSVAVFRNTVYVSTLSGVFTKPVRTFLTPKKDK